MLMGMLPVSAGASLSWWEGLQVCCSHSAIPNSAAPCFEAVLTRSWAILGGAVGRSNNLQQQKKCSGAKLKGMQNHA